MPKLSLRKPRIYFCLSHKEEKVAVFWQRNLEPMFSSLKITSTVCRDLAIESLLDKTGCAEIGEVQINERHLVLKFYRFGFKKPFPHINTKVPSTIN